MHRFLLQGKASMSDRCHLVSSSLPQRHFWARLLRHPPIANTTIFLPAIQIMYMMAASSAKLNSAQQARSHPQQQVPLMTMSATECLVAAHALSVLLLAAWHAHPGVACRAPSCWARTKPAMLAARASRLSDGSRGSRSKLIADELGNDVVDQRA